MGKHWRSFYFLLTIHIWTTLASPGSAVAPNNCFLFSENCVGCVYVCVHEEAEGICWEGGGGGGGRRNHVCMWGGGEEGGIMCACGEGGRKEESCVHMGREDCLDCTALLFRALQRFLELLCI